MKLQFLKKKKKIKKENFKIDAGFYWNIILLLAFILIICAFVFGFFVFQKINKGEEIVTDISSENVNIVKKQRIDKVLEYFTDREKRSIDILNSPSPVVDPSL